MQSLILMGHNKFDFGVLNYAAYVKFSLPYNALNVITYCFKVCSPNASFLYAVLQICCPSLTKFACCCCDSYDMNWSFGRL